MRRILWFRRDLRIDDNRLLALDGEVLPIFVFDTEILDPLPKNDRRVSFIFEQAMQLKTALKKRNLDLALFYGSPEAVFSYLLGMHFDEVCASGDYDPYARERDRRISQLLPFRFIHDTYIFKPDEVLKADGSPYLVFTPYYRRAAALMSAAHTAQSAPCIQTLLSFDYSPIHNVENAAVTKLAPKLASIGFDPLVHGVIPVQESLQYFEMNLDAYAKKRDMLCESATSALSVHLRFGTLGIRTLLRWLFARQNDRNAAEPFLRQLIFRDYYACLLYHFPYLMQENFRHPFNGKADETRFKAFCEARTGVPVVDAGIRELLASGKMHNRVRMICASFFTKDLLLPWQWGEAFFARRLLDYDAASNALSWQWSAGTGIDPQPYFRIFNPYLQSKKFDPDARYIKQWVPELRGTEAKLLHDENALLRHPVEHYPAAIVVHKEASAAALEYFKLSLENSGSQRAIR